ncbi:hypothetical protein BH10PSE19_BH10PSE19_00990 [soil metagenome]
MLLSRYTFSLMTLTVMWTSFTHAATLEKTTCNQKDTQVITDVISDYVSKNSALTSTKFGVVFKHCLNNYALFKIHPEKAQTDDAYVFLHKDKKWQVMAMGTYFEDAFLQKLPKELRKLP